MFSLSSPRFAVAANNPALAGQMASRRKFLFGYGSRYALYAVHTRFDAVQWFVADAEVPDELTGLPSIIRQEASPEEAMRGLDA